MSLNRALCGPVIRTFFYYVVPSIIGLLAITSANLIDGLFIGNALGTDALAAITLMIPYFTLLISIAIMFAIGGAVSAGKAIGENDFKMANAVFSQSLIAALAVNFIFAIVGFLFSDTLFQLLNIPEQIIPLASEYFHVICWVFVIQLTTMVLYYFVRADGHPMLATFALVVGAVLNIIFDAWFIFYLDMGLAGAAYATAIAQTVQCLLLLQYFFKKDRTMMFELHQSNWSIILRCAYNGVSEFINEISVGIIFFILNWLMLSRLGVDGVAAFTIINYFIFLSIMISYGFADALHLLVSQNFGAKQRDRIRLFLLTALCCSLTLGVFIVFLLTTYPLVTVGWFIDERNINIFDLTTNLLPLLLPLFLVNGSNIILTCYLTAIHQPKQSALIALTRSLILPTTLLLGLYYFGPQWQILPANMTEYTFILALPLAEWIAFIMAVYFCSQFSPKRLNINSQTQNFDLS